MWRNLVYANDPQNGKFDITKDSVFNMNLGFVATFDDKPKANNGGSAVTYTYGLSAET